MNCPTCGKALDPEHHGDLVCDGQVWCDGCHRYDDRLMEVLSFSDLEAWTQRLCRAFNQEPVHLRHDPDYLPDPKKYWDGATFLLAEAFHEPRCIMLYPPGQRLMTLCHELAHLFTGQDHTEVWAKTFADLIAWVKVRV
jgi:hypothetical protein